MWDPLRVKGDTIILITPNKRLKFVGLLMARMFNNIHPLW